MNEDSRLELKYQLRLADYYRVRCALAGFVEFDPFARRAAGGKYLVRSLYFDTSDYQAYADKKTGETDRIKLRWRVYSAAREENRFVNVELKTRHGRFVTKYATRVAVAACDAFLAARAWPQTDDRVLIDFERLVRLRGLRPKALVDYWREAYVAKDGSDARITFDHAIRYAGAAELFPRAALFRDDAHDVIMEIKTKNQEPRWLQQIVQCYELRAAPNSKYAYAIEQTQNQLFHA